MKKSLKVLVALLVLVLATGCGSKSTSDVDPMEQFGCNTLNVYNWGEYIAPEILSDFEGAYNVRINYSLFDSNEVMYTKLLGGNQYDILIPSDYMVERLIAEGLLQEIDWDKITNSSNIYERILDTPNDPGNIYSVPYFWGSIGILYDKTIVDPADVESQGFEVMKNETYKNQVFMYDSERDSFMIALKALGYSMNTENADEIQEAYEWLIDLDDKVNPSYVTDEVIDGMIIGEKALAVVYSGDAAYILSENENMAYYLPESGTNTWVDGMVIPANAACPNLAHEFMNYILDDEVAYTNSSEIGYASPNKKVLDEMIAEGGEYADNEAYFPRSDYAKDEVFRHNEEMKKILSDLWIKVKTR